jgi:hypothetical protein
MVARNRNQNSRGPRGGYTRNGAPLKKRVEDLYDGTTEGWTRVRVTRIAVFQECRARTRPMPAAGR